MDPWESPSFEAMSNFDHTIEADADERLKKGELGKYSGWNFWAIIRYNQGQFECQVWQYNVPREIITAPSLTEIMDAVSQKYGDE